MTAMGPAGCIVRGHTKYSAARPVRMVIDEFTLTYPGIKQVEHVYFHAVHGADDATRQRYLDRAYDLGRGF